jgi:hypothetical protein
MYESNRGMEPPPRAYVEHSLSASSKRPRPLKPSTPCNQPTLPTAVKSRTPPCGAGLGGVGGLNLAWSASAGIRQASGSTLPGFPIPDSRVPAPRTLATSVHPNSVPRALRPDRQLQTVTMTHVPTAWVRVSRYGEKETCLQRVTTSLSPPPPPPRESSGPRQQVY